MKYTIICLLVAVLILAVCVESLEQGKAKGSADKGKGKGQGKGVKAQGKLKGGKGKAKKAQLTIGKGKGKGKKVLVTDLVKLHRLCTFQRVGIEELDSFVDAEEETLHITVNDVDASTVDEGVGQIDGGDTTAPITQQFLAIGAKVCAKVEGKPIRKGKASKDTTVSKAVKANSKIILPTKAYVFDSAVIKADTPDDVIFKCCLPKKAKGENKGNGKGKGKGLNKDGKKNGHIASNGSESGKGKDKGKGKKDKAGKHAGRKEKGKNHKKSA